MRDREHDRWLRRVTEERLLLFAGLALFYFGHYIRSVFSENSVNQYFNAPAIAVLVILIITYAFEKRLEPGIFILVVYFACLAGLSNLNGGQNLFNQAVTMVNIVMPLLLIGLHLDNRIINSVFQAFLKVMTVICALMVCFGMADLILGQAPQRFLIDNVFATDLARLASMNISTGIYRLHFFGHPLTLAWQFLLFFTLHVINNKYNKRIMPMPWVAAITLAGLVLCNSRTALVIGAIMILLFNGEKHRRLAYLAVVFAIAGSIALVPAMRDNVVQRFTSEMQQDSVSGGRNEAAQMVLEEYADSPGLILGKGLGYSRKITRDMGAFIHSFEYPVLMFAYDYSVLGTMLLYGIILVLPLTMLYKDKRWLEMSLFALLSLYMNGFNHLANGVDGMVEFCFATMLLLNIGRREQGT